MFSGFERAVLCHVVTLVILFRCMKIVWITKKNRIKKIFECLETSENQCIVRVFHDKKIKEFFYFDMLYTNSNWYLLLFIYLWQWSCNMKWSKKLAYKFNILGFWQVTCLNTACCHLWQMCTVYFLYNY